jgi:hypothetical protein
MHSSTVHLMSVLCWCLLNINTVNDATDEEALPSLSLVMLREADHCHLLCGSSVRSTEEIQVIINNL